MITSHPMVLLVLSCALTAPLGGGVCSQVCATGELWI